MADQPNQPVNGPADGAPPSTPPAPKPNSAAEAALEAAKAAISQLGDLNNLVNEAAPSDEISPPPTEGEVDFAAQMAAAIEAEKAEKAAAHMASKPPPAGSKPLDLPSLAGDLAPAQVHALDLLGDVHLNVKIELGRTRMLVEDLLRLSEGAVVELDKLAGDPVDVYVNERHVARGEVLVLNDNFCVRINEVLTPANAAPEKGAA
jgi:flagellar motor switch protein FliN/FliY